MAKLFPVLVTLVTFLVAVFSSSLRSDPTIPKPKKWNRFVKTVLNELIKVRFQAEQMLINENLDMAPSPDYPYWNWLPQYIDSVRESKPTASWSAPCYASNNAVFSKSTDGKSWNVQITSSKATSISCSDLYAAFTASSVAISTEIRGSKNSQTVTNIVLPIPEDVTDAEQWDVDEKGVRLFRYLNDKTTTISNLVETLKMFVPETTMGVSDEAAAINVDFLTKYTNLPAMVPIDPSSLTIPDESQVKSGDAFYIIRLDGLDPMLAWAMGSTTGHVTTAMWIEGELYVCESTVADSYWPTDNVQRTPYRQWIQQATDADMNVVWAPLSDEARKSYNETAAIEFFKEVEGTEYGFQTMLWAWLDTAMGNFPCLPTDYSSNCMQWEVLEVFIALVDRAVPEIGDTMWNPGFAKRLNVADGMRTADYFREAGKQGMVMTDVIQIVEQDSWRYATTKNGEPYANGHAMVCCVFVCNTWKAAGVFGANTDSINCAEFTNYDDYALKIHADTYHQILGKYSLKLNDFRITDVYPHMAEHCTALPPDYIRPVGC